MRDDATFFCGIVRVGIDAVGPALVVTGPRCGTEHILGHMIFQLLRSRTSGHLAFFTRLLDEAPAAERYRLAAEQMVFAEAFPASTPPGVGAAPFP